MLTVALYTVAGATASMLTGAALGLAGGLLLPERARPGGIPVLMVVGVVAAARELGWIRVPLPQPRRQTKELWAKVLQLPVAATLWGFDLGLLVTTRFTFAGTWLLLLLPILVGKGVFGAWLLLAYWAGRLIPVWIGPLLLNDASRTPGLLDEIGHRSRALGLAHVAGVGLLMAFLAQSLA